MAVLLVQVDDTLKLVDPDSGVVSALTLPTGVTIDATRKPSIATLAYGAVIVNSPSRNLLMDREGTLRVLVPEPPTTNLSAAVGAAGVLTGDYYYTYSFITKDGDGNVINESPMAPVSNTVTLTADQANLTSIDVSTDDVTGRRLYRTLSTGTVLYHLADIDDNTTTIYTDNAADATLSILPAQGYVTEGPPGTLTTDEFRLRLVVSWKNRIWGLTDDPNRLDEVLYTEDGLVYRWPNVISAYPIGQELNGVVCLVPRRDQLGVAKRNGVWQITGDSDLNFRIVQLSFGKGGCIAERSAVTTNDVVRWLGPDGVYEWGTDGSIQSISDQAVRPWFAGDDFFNTALFVDAFAKFNPLRTQYELHLVEAGETTSTLWVAYNTTTKMWYGPHKTTETSYSCAASTETAEGLPRTIVGAINGRLYTLSLTTFHDGTIEPIDFDVLTPFYTGDNPDIEHFWGATTILYKTEELGVLEVTPLTGVLDSSSQTARDVDLTKGRQRIGILGTGRVMQLRFQNAVEDEDVAIHGFETPFHELGRR